MYLLSQRDSRWKLFLKLVIRVFFRKNRHNDSNSYPNECIDAKTALSNCSEMNFVFKQQRYLFHATLGSQPICTRQTSSKVFSEKLGGLYSFPERLHNIFTYILIWFWHLIIPFTISGSRWSRPFNFLCSTISWLDGLLISLRCPPYLL